MEDVQIDLLRADDIDGLLALQEANQAEHGGMLSARMPRAFFAAAPGAMPAIVARRGERVVTFLVSAPKQPQPEAPVVQHRVDPCTHENGHAAGGGIPA